VEFPKVKVLSTTDFKKEQSPEEGLNLFVGKKKWEEQEFEGKELIHASTQLSLSREEQAVEMSTFIVPFLKRYELGKKNLEIGGNESVFMRIETMYPNLKKFQDSESKRTIIAGLKGYFIEQQVASAA